MAKDPTVQKIYVIHENDAWVEPLRAAFSALDLPYEEDSRAEVDTNVVATNTGTLIEVQGTGEGATFSRKTLDTMLDIALAGIRQLTDLQVSALAEPYPGELP